MRSAPALNAGGAPVNDQHAGVDRLALGVEQPEECRVVDGVAPFRPVERDHEHVTVSRHAYHVATLRAAIPEPSRGGCVSASVVARCGEAMSDISPLQFHVPEPPARPGEQPDFSYVVVPDAGAVRRPDVHVDPAEIRDLAYDLIPRARRGRPRPGPVGAADRRRLAASSTAGDGEDARL